MIHKASELSFEQRAALESLLGRAISDRETVSVRVFEPPPLSGEHRQATLPGREIGDPPRVGATLPALGGKSEVWVIGNQRAGARDRRDARLRRDRPFRIWAER